MIAGPAKVMTSSRTSAKGGRESVVEMLVAPPSCPPGLAEYGVTVEHVRKGCQIDASVSGDLRKRALQLGSVSRVASGEDVDVGKVAPPGVSSAAL